MKQKSALIFIFLFLNNHGFSQVKMKINGGVGFPEIINLGVAFQNNDRGQFGFQFGKIPVYGESVTAFTGSYAWYFGDSARKSKKRAFYAKALFTIAVDETVEIYERHDILSLRLGREFNFNRRSGLFFELGGGWETFTHVYLKKPNLKLDDYYSIKSPWYISFCLNWFYRI